MPKSKPAPESELFANRSTHEPLAFRMRPRNLDEFVGQEHILAPGRLLRRSIQADQLSSVIFYGPPGTGKTTLARIIANTTQSLFITVNAVLAGKQEIRDSVDKAKQHRDYYDRRTILFVDEVHRWNKAQQDALLPWVESGIIVLIGATTENPFFEVIKALVSRSRIFQLRPLEEADLYELTRRTLSDRERGYGRWNVTLDDDAFAHLVKVANGDARTLLNALELAVETTPSSWPPPDGTAIRIDTATAEDSIQKKAVLYDKEGDYHFDVISAFIKSLRGSDPDAALYWLARMVVAGEDPLFIFRRMMIFASEDVGMADPNALVFAQNAAAAYERVGMPEGHYFLAHCVLYLSTAPKSNSAMGYFDARGVVEAERDADVPNHLKDASRDGPALGHGKGYLYPHAYRDHWVKQNYLPSALQGRVFYRPGAIGSEAAIREEVLARREVQLSAMVEDRDDEYLSFTPPDAKQDRWFARSLSGRSEILAAVRDRVFEGVTLRRSDRVLDLNAGSGLLVWEALRRVPEGGVWALCRKPEEAEILANYAETLEETRRPFLVPGDFGSMDIEQTAAAFSDVRFECVIGRDVLSRVVDRADFLRRLANFVALGPVLSGVEAAVEGRGAQLSLAEPYAREGQRLSALLAPGVLPADELALLHQAEESLYAGGSSARTNWTPEDLATAAQEAGWIEVRVETVPLRGRRSLSAPILREWFAPKQGASLGDHLRAAAGESAGAIVEKVVAALSGKDVEWTTPWVFLRGKGQEDD